jgi:predicted permease
VIPLAAVIGAATAVGVGAERRLGPAAETAADKAMRAVLGVLLPIVAFFNIAALELKVEVGAGIAFGYAAIAICLSAAYVLGRYVFRLPGPGVGALMLVAALANTGYLGLPFNAALFGLDALPDAVAYDVLVSSIVLVTAGFSIGAAFGTIAERRRERVAAFLLRNPPLWACLAALVAPDALAPSWAVDGSQAIVFLILPLGFFAVGVTLAAAGEGGSTGFPPPVTAEIGAAVALKLIVSPGVVLALSALLLRVPDPYLTQPAMASAVNTIVVANEYGLDRVLCAAVIVWTTVVVVAAGLAAALL